MAKTTPRFNKSTGLFGMGGGKRKGAKSKIRQALDDLKRSKNKKVLKSAKKANKSRVKAMKKQLKGELKAQGMKGKIARQTAKDTAPLIVQKQKEETLANKIKAKEVAKQEMLQRQKEVTKQKEESKKNTTPTPSNINKGKSDPRAIQKENERIRKNQQARRDASAEGSAYKITMRDGSIKNVLARKPGESDADFKKRFAEMRKTKSAKHGGALAIMIAPVKSKKMKGVKAVKKAPGGAKMKEAMYGAKMKKAKMGGKLKPVPSENKGLSKLPKEVRNKMGYMKHGGKLKDKMMYGGSMKKAMYGAKMKKKAMYGAKMKK